VTSRAVTGMTLFDGTGAAPLSDASVVWSGDRIEYAGPSAAAPIDGAEVIAAGGHLLPGLIDSHVHLCFDGTLDGVDDISTEPLDMVRRRAMEGARILLAAGITTARDQGSREGVAIDVAAAQRSGELDGARILAAGRGITPSGGHGWMIGVEADGPQAVAAAVTAEIERGADVIKLFPTGGVLGSGAHGFDLVMSAEELEAAVAVAHEAGLLIGAHVHGRPGIDAALAAGIDTIEHATDITTEQALRSADQGVALVPTLAAIDLLLPHGDSVSADLLTRASEVRDTQAAGIARAIEAGATVLPGTDAGTPFNPVGNLVHEMETLADLGLGKEGVIHAATGGAAAILRRTDLGVLERGRTADMIVVDDDPRRGLATLRRPRIVIQDGVPISD